MIKNLREKTHLGNKGINILLMLILKAVYEIVFALVTSTLYEYIGLWYEPNYEKMVWSYVLAIAVIIIIPNNNKKPSNYLIYIFYYFTLLPLLSLYWQQDQATEYIVYCVISFVILCASTAFFGMKMSDKRIHIIHKNIDLYFWIYIFSFIFVLFTIALYGIPNLGALDFANIYSIRAEKNYTGIGGYIINWLPKVFIPSLMGLSLFYKKRFSMLIAVFLQFFMFLTTANKTIYFSIFFILGIYFIITVFSEKCMYFLALGLAALHALGVLLLNRFGNIFLFSTISYRLSAVPANVSYQHYIFFSENKKLYFSENFIGRLLGIESPYDEAASYMLGYKGSNSNTGVFGDAYDNGGFIVMIIYMIILSIILAYIDRKYASAHNPKLLATVVSILSYSIIGLNDTSLTIVLFTGGLVFILLIIKIFVEQETICEDNAITDG